MSTVEELSYSPSEGQKNRDAAQVAATGRRSWKTLKGKPEAVWPPSLECALIEALEEYRKMEARPTTSKFGVRYPMRNRFISDYIFEKTGKTRTAKQVGSRLQQLRDTCKDGRLSSLLGKSTSQEPECKAEQSPTPSLAGRNLTNSPSPPVEDKLAIYVQLECPNDRISGPTHMPQIQFKPNRMDTPHYLYLMPLPRHHSESPYPSPSLTLSSFSSFVEIVSPFNLMPETSWTVYKGSTMIHQEHSALRVGSPLTTSAGRVYVCELVPSYWPILCDREDPNYITVVQVLRSSPSSESSSLANAMGSGAKEVTIVYHFNVPDLSKLKIRPSPSTDIHTGLPTYSSPSPASRTHPPSRTPSYPDYGGSSQGTGHYWPSCGQDSLTYREAGLPNIRSIHQPPMTTASTSSHSMEDGHYTLNLPRWDNYGVAGADGGERFGANAALPTYYGEPRATQWEMNGLATGAPAFGRRETTRYPVGDSSCY